VTFNLRGYADVLAVRRHASASGPPGGCSYKDGKLNLIIGEYHKRIDKGKKNVEGSFGVTEDYRDVNFDIAGRQQQGPHARTHRRTPPASSTVGAESRPDWVSHRGAQGRQGLSRRADAGRRSARKKRRCATRAAKLTLERREMREEMARMRKELQTLQ
jgi:hypothetical protein